ncbi:protein mab-21-like 3 [Saccoglossus kowalevskii]|uniref:Protein mab-21-like 3-like n=1 Tax=Saccoglossus kowalevskii TaxID=10224 RepID=A0ABM0MTS2_SACKO|nr:PREDICTED: protein mab-21-like 3-like [Saccoglossus kowalevskii]
MAMFAAFTDENDEFCQSLKQYAEVRAKVDEGAENDAITELQGILHPIMKFIHKKDRRFDDSVIPVGRHTLNMKVIENESADFELLVPILGLPDPKWSFNDRPRLYDFTNSIDGKIRLVRRHRTKPLPEPITGQHFLWIEDRTMSRSWNDWIFNRDLIPCKVKARLRELVDAAIHEGHSKGAVALLAAPKGCARLRIHFSRGAIHAVLRPTVLSEGSGFPSEVHSEWPRSHLWPQGFKVKDLRKIGTDSVAIDDLYWSQSYSQCEEFLVNSIDRDGGCRKVCLRILEKLREEHWCPNSVGNKEPALTYYHLQTALLWQCEEWSFTVDWIRDKLPIRFISIVRRLLQWVSARRLNHYFLSSVNLFADNNGKLKDEEGLRNVQESIESFVRSPHLFLSDSVPINHDLPDILKNSSESKLKRNNDDSNVTTDPL